MEIGGMMSMRDREVTLAVDEGSGVGMDLRVVGIVVTREGQEVEDVVKVDVSDEGVVEKGNSDSMKRT